MFIDGEVSHGYWKSDPYRVMTVEELFNIIAPHIYVKMGGAKDELESLFKNTSGKRIVTEPPYLYQINKKSINNL